MNILNKIYQRLMDKLVVRKERNEQIQECNYRDDYYGDRVCLVATTKAVKK